MTEPVAYLQLDIHGKEMVHIEKDMNGYETKPLYTADQLHPRVKMTKEQYKEWQSAISNIYPVDLYELFNLIFNPAEHRGKYMGMRDIFSFNEGQKRLSKLWSDYDQDNPEETIEIVPNMKWFVRSKKVVGENNYYAWLFDNDYLDVPQCMISDVIPSLAMRFDTKEEAEKWTNPLTEVVQLPVERSNE